jgi:hypothetical protein
MRQLNLWNEERFCFLENTLALGHVSTKQLALSLQDRTRWMLVGRTERHQHRPWGRQWCWLISTWRGEWEMLTPLSVVDTTPFLVALSTLSWVSALVITIFIWDRCWQLCLPSKRTVWWKCEAVYYSTDKRDISFQVLSHRIGWKRYWNLNLIMTEVAILFV